MWSSATPPRCSTAPRNVPEMHGVETDRVNHGRFGGITMLNELRHAKGDQRTLSHEEAVKLLGEAIYLARRRRDISQEQAAHLAEVSVETYVAMEHGYSARGRPANPTLKTLVSVLSALHFELDQLARVIETTDEIGLTPPD